MSTDKSLYHTSHDSVSIVRTTFKVYGKNANFDPQPTKNPWTDRHQIWMGMITSWAPTTKKIGLNPPRSFCSLLETVRDRAKVAIDHYNRKSHISSIRWYENRGRTWRVITHFAMPIVRYCD